LTITIKADDGTGDANLIWEWKTGDGGTWTGGTVTTVNNQYVLPKGGTVAVGEALTPNAGKLVLSGGGRFLLGLNDTNNNDTVNAHLDGELDFTRKFKISVTYDSYASTGTDYAFAVILSNTMGNTSRGPATFHPTSPNATVFTGTNVDGGGNTDACLVRANTPVAGGDTMTAIIDPANISLRAEAVTAELVKNTVLEKSYLQFRMENAATTLVISKIRIEYVVD